MKNRTMIFIFGGVFILLMIISVIQSNQQNPVVIRTPVSGSEAALNNPYRLFKDFQPEDIKAFGMLDPDTLLTFTLIRDEDRWTTLEFGDVIESGGAETLAFTAAVMPYLTILEDVEPERYEEFGLTSDQAFLLISIVLKDDTEHGIIIGDVLPNNAGHYAVIDDNPEVYALDARPIAYLVSYLRQLYLPPTEQPEVTATSGE